MRVVISGPIDKINELLDEAKYQLSKQALADDGGVIEESFYLPHGLKGPGIVDEVELCFTENSVLSSDEPVMIEVQGGIST